MSHYSLSNIKSYLVGKLRYKCFHSEAFYGLLRDHIEEQITWRIEVMDDVCYNSGSCEVCGCETTALQMADKACDKPCYPSMMNSREWKMFNRGGLFWDRETELFWALIGKAKKLISFRTQIQYQNHVERNS